jgi:antitoxin ParD1/3/4
MATMNISLPEQMKTWVEAQSESGSYSNSSDFVRDLIRREQVRREKIAHMQAMVDEGFASGISTLTMDELLASAKEQTARRLNGV